MEYQIYLNCISHFMYSIYKGIYVVYDMSGNSLKDTDANLPGYSWPADQDSAHLIFRKC